MVSQSGEAWAGILTRVGSRLILCCRFGLPVISIISRSMAKIAYRSASSFSRAPSFLLTMAQVRDYARESYRSACSLMCGKES